MSDSGPDSVLIEAYELLRGGDVAPWLEIYAAFTPEMRAEFPDVVRSVLGLPDGVATAELVSPLYGEEREAGIRRRLIDHLAAEPCEESVAVLSEWQSLAPDRAERAELRSALRQLESRGIPWPRAPGPVLRAWLSSADGMGSYHLMIEIPLRAGPVFLAYALNVEGGLREAERLGAEGAGFFTRFAEDSGLIAASISPALAVREVREGARRCEQTGRDVPEGWLDTVSWLERIPSVTGLDPVPEGDPEPAIPASTGARLGTRALALRREYESWFLPPVEVLRKKAHAYFQRPEQQPTIRPARHGKEMRALVAELIGRREYRERLVRMLEHQARVYARVGDGSAERAARRAAREVLEGTCDRGFLRVFAERSVECLFEELLAPDPLPPDERRATWRSVLRRAESIDRADVARLDFAVLFDHVLATELDLVALAERPTEDQVVEALIECASQVVERLRQRASQARASRRILTRQDARTLAAGFATVLRRRTPLRQRSVASLARVLAERALDFANDICGVYCMHGCPGRLADPGAALFEHGEHPARMDPEPAVPEPEDRALVREQVGRALDLCRRLGLEDARLDALDSRLSSLGRDPDGAQVNAFRQQAARSLRGVLDHALDVLPRLRPSSDPATRGAWERFARAYSVLPVELVSRMIARCSQPSDLLCLLFSVSEPRRDMAEARELVAAAQLLWNATPRAELGGKTPNQAGEGTRG